MKSLLFALTLGCLTVVGAEDARPLLVHAGKTIAQPDLKQALAPEWSVQKGTWEVKDGELIATELPEEKHAAVLWHKVGLQSAIVECEFQFDGAKSFLIGCDSSGKHVGRLVITPKLAKLAEDSSEIKGKQPGQTIGQTAVDLKPGSWYKVRLEWTGDKMAALVDGKEIEGTHPTLSTAKARWWFAVSGAKARIRNVKVSEGK